MSAEAAGPSLGVIVPCHDEAAVIERKLRNLARAEWPRAARPHRLLVVDDHSDDATGPLAARCCAELFDADVVRAELLVNPGAAGKPTAVGAALDALGEEVDLVVLSDADVILGHGALTSLAQALADAPQLGMVCGRQRFVDTLGPEDSSAETLDLRSANRAGLYDRLTAWVRGLESRGGRLFSVHGQLLAWRAALDLRPSAGIAADDLELMLGVRRAGLGVALADGAFFVEAKPDPQHRRTQQIRRARAYVQIAPRFVAWPGADNTSRLQLGAYRVLPLAAPWWVPLACVLLPTLVLISFPTRPVFLLVQLLALGLIGFLLLPAGKRCVRLLSIIAAAKQLESREALSDRWEMPRR